MVVRDHSTTPQPCFCAIARIVYASSDEDKNMKIIAIFSVFVCFILFAVPGVASTRPLVTGNWIMGCDNRGQCTATGYYEREPDRNDQFGEANWYVVVKWHEGHETPPSLQLHPLDRQVTDVSMALTQHSSLKQPYALQAERKQSGMMSYSTTIRQDEMLAADRLTLSFYHRDEDGNTPVSRKETLDLAAFKAFFIEHGGRHQAVLPEPTAVTAYPWSNKRLIEKPLLDTWLDDYGDPLGFESCDQSESSPDDAAYNYSIEIENFGELVVLCNDTGYNYSSTLWRRDGDALLPIQFSSGSRRMLSEFGIILENRDDGTSRENLLTGFDLDENDRHVFESRGKGRGLGDCGAVFTFVFNGQQFEVVHYEQMPKCVGINDWIPLYDRPVQRQY